MTPNGFHEHAGMPAPMRSGPAGLCSRSAAQWRKMSAILFFCMAFVLSRANAAPLVIDNFSGPVANAAGQFPTFGTNPWTCVGPAAGNCIRGNGQMTTSLPGAGTIYYMMHTTGTPLHVRYQFTDAVEAPTLLVAVTRDGTLDNMWHVAGFRNPSPNFGFRQSYWCTTGAVCPASSSDVMAADPGSNYGPCPRTVVNHSYVGSISFYGNTSVATLQDAATGTVLCTNTASDPKLSGLIGPNFYLETFANTPNIVFTSVEADDTPPARISGALASAPANTRAVTRAVDASFLNNSAIFNPLLSLSAGQLTDNVAQLSGEVASLSAGAAISASSDFMNLMLGPLSAARGGGTQIGRPFGARRGNAVSDRFAVWIGGYGEPGHLSGNAGSGAHREDQSQAGAAIGFDYRPTVGFTLGGAVGEARLDWSLPDLVSTGRADVTQAGLYASAHGTRRYAELGLTYSALAMKTLRNVTLAGANQYAGSFHAADFGARFETGQHVWRRDDAFPLMIYAAGEMQRFTAPGYSEFTLAGSTAMALAFASPNKTSLFTDLGLRVDSWRIAAVNADFHASLAWRHLFSPVQSVSATFLGSPITSFTVIGAPLAANSAVTSVGTDIKLPGHLLLGVAFTGAFATHSASYGGLASLRHSW